VITMLLRTRTLLISGVVTLAGVIGTALPAAAVPGHTSCAGLGALTVSEAHDGSLVTELRSLPPGSAAQLVALVQVGGTFDGEPVPAFCVLK